MNLEPLQELEGWLHPDEGRRLAELALQVPSGQVIVELGSYRGKSSCYLAEGSRAGNRVPVYCVDLWDAGGQWETDEARRPGPPLHFDDPEHRRKFRENTAPYGDLIVEVQGNTAQAGEQWAGGRTVGLLFIDADHTFDGVTDDLIAWVPHVAPGGWIAVHDYRNADYPEIRQAVDALFGDQVCECGQLVMSMLTVPV